MLTTLTPTKTYLAPNTPQWDAIKKYLTYTSLTADYELKRFRNNVWMARQMSREDWLAKIEDLKAARRKCLLFEDSLGAYTYSGLAQQLSLQFGLPLKNEIVYPKYGEIVWHKPTMPLRPYQEASLQKLLEIRHGAVSIGCHRRGEKVLMFDGTLKCVEDVEVGDKLMGPDSTARTVLELKSGVDSMYKVETVNGQRMFVNGEHILSLRKTTSSNKKDCFACYRPKENILKTVNEYLKTSNKFKHLHKLYTVGVEFKETPLSVPPYILGILLGDGHVGKVTNITTMDPEVVVEIRNYAELLGLKVVETHKDNNKATTYAFSRTLGSPQENVLTKKLRELKISGVECGDKFIPKPYLVNSRANRLEILAGLIDTDGSLVDGCYDYISKSRQLASDVAFLVRSLGLRATVRECQKSCQTGATGTYHRVTISGETSIIPVRIQRKKALPRKQIKKSSSFGFSVEKVSDSEQHFGFVLDKDHLYLTDSFLVTHNTGLGKSYIILHLAKTIGLKTVIMAPLTSIAEQLHKDFLRHLGPKYVGFYGGGKHEHRKLFTIAIAQSLTRVVPGTPEHDSFSKAQVFIADESHQTPASTLANVCMDLFANAPYRYFFSGTQIRNDGADLLLDGIIGKIVYDMTVREGVDQGYLAKPKFTFYRLTSNDPHTYADPNKSTRKHFYYNRKVVKAAADVINTAYTKFGHSVLVLIDEFEQFADLLPLLKGKVGFAHGGVTKATKDKVPPDFHKSDPQALVESFNNRELPILIGTSCIATGVDIRSVKTMVYLRGGTSEIELSQGIGRGTRLFELGDYVKKSFNFFDFDIANEPTLHRHTLERIKICNSIYPNLKFVDLEHIDET